ncbi:MAG: T9SS type A sorting domain-containing protein [Bacteroidales bacterium]|nr:T9SS type A sorting domain-containing protein [Bacteroidales bacterium]
MEKEKSLINILSKTFIILIIFLSNSLLANSSDTLKVLFIGNCLSAFNNLPEMFQNMSEAGGKTVFSKNETVPNTLLEDHLIRPATINSLHEKKWNYVILQLTPSYPGLLDTYQTVETFNTLIKENYQCTKTILFMPWTMKNTEYNYPLIFTTTLDYAKKINACVAPIGQIWHDALKLDPIPELYLDLGHPNPAGTYASACGFYTLIFNENPEEVEFYASVPENEAKVLQTLTKTVVLYNINNWLTKYFAKFSHAIYGSAVQFENLTFDNISSYWDFGDGNYSNEKSPQHIYTSHGNYNVSLITQSNNCHNTTDTCFKNLKIGTGEDISLTPNPVKTKLTIELKEAISDFNLYIFDSKGMKIYFKNVLKETNRIVLDTSTFSKGFYFLYFECGNLNYKRKFIKI